MSFLILRISACRAVLGLSCIAVAAFALLAPAPYAQAAIRQLPGSRIAIDLDPAFTESHQFPGFIDHQTGAFFAVIELPASAYDRIRTIPESPEALANEGFSGTEKAELKGREGNFVYLVGKQHPTGGDITKFVLLFTQSDITGVIIVSVPQAAMDAGAYRQQAIEAILANATVRDKPADPSDVFRLSHLGPFKEAFNDGGLTKAYNISGDQPHSGGNQLVKESMLLVSASIHGDAIDLKAEADKAFTTLGGMKDRQIEEQKEVTIASLKGYQITGQGTDAASGNKIALRLVVLSGEPFGCFMFLGSVPVAEKERMMPEIEKIIASFELAK